MSFDYAALMNQHAMLQVQCQHWQKECMKLEGERDQLKASYIEIESALVTKNHEAHDLEMENRQLKAENERLETALATSLFLLPRKIKQLDEARELLTSWRLHSPEHVAAWLEKTK